MTQLVGKLLKGFAQRKQIPCFSEMIGGGEIDEKPEKTTAAACIRDAMPGLPGSKASFYASIPSFRSDASFYAIFIHVGDPFSGWHDRGEVTGPGSESGSVWPWSFSATSRRACSAGTAPITRSPVFSCAATPTGVFPKFPPTTRRPYHR